MASEHDELHKVKILVVDDEPANLVALEASLSGLGQELVKARSGSEALKALLEGDFAVVLLDVQMPQMDGFETAALIRQRDRSRHTPIIFLTAISKTDEHVFLGHSLGAVDYLFKPFVPEVLRSKVAVFVELARKTEQVRRLNQDLRQRLQELSSINQELEAFSFSISHDLRAPLRAIDGFSRALLEDYADKLDEEGRAHLQRVRAATLRMGQLIDDLLNLARVTRVEMRREKVDLSALAKAVACELAQVEPSRTVEFVIAEGAVVEGDPCLLRVALENLLGNAWKYSGKHPKARIEFGVSRQNGRAAYYVRDDGAGFDATRAEKLFAAFQRFHSLSEFEGTGVGLATVRRIVHRHGGEIWAEAAVERGATFSFTLPGTEELP